MSNENMVHNRARETPLIHGKTAHDEVADAVKSQQEVLYRTPSGFRAASQPAARCRLLGFETADMVRGSARGSWHELHTTE
jgi:hypothetical protein